MAPTAKATNTNAPFKKWLISSFSESLPKGRIKSLDILRGLAIIMMTIPHQTIVFGLKHSLVGHQLYMIGYYYTRPMFIAVSGMAIVLYERKYRCPFRMIVHGVVLFLMAWCVDIITHQNYGIDWDIFQLIGGCYALAGLFNYIERNDLRLLGVFALILFWFFLPGMRPDQGHTPIWPFGIYFLGGYLIGKWGIGQYNRMWSVLMVLMASIAYLVYFYMFCERTLELSTNAYGIAATHAVIFVLLCLTLFLEKQNFANKQPLSMILRFGIYPVTLYFIQQFFVVFGLAINLKLALTGNASIDCILHTTVLLIGMYISTYLFDRLKFLSIEFWLRKSESIVMDFVPERGIFKPFSSKEFLG
ncbi:MAG: DUF1624 domain-containing protein [Deltaproteobacteria bacterium]|jgi:surface polysaccharide O-acyltransferase-like enzyme|nr:DUF1624 domain-containing protein [Deltaproteobacteria bacterium]